MPTPKKQTKKLKINNLTGNKKRLAVLVFAFAVVGTALLIRSFAATTIISFNPGDNFSNNNIPGLAFKNANVVTETVTDGKKTTTANLLEIKKNTIDGVRQDGEVSYTAKLNAGYYEACATLKPTLAGSAALLYVGKDRYAGSSAIAIMGEKSAESFFTGLNTTVFNINQSKKVCASFGVSQADNGQPYIMAVNTASDKDSTWRISNMTLSLVSSVVTQGALVQAAKGPADPFGASGIGMSLPPSDLVRLVGDHEVRVKTLVDTVNGLQQEVVELNGGTLHYSRSDYPVGTVSKTKSYRFCALMKNPNPDSNPNAGVISKLTMYRGSSDAGTSYTPTAIGLQYVKKCTSSLTKSSQNGLDARIQTIGSGWRIADAWIEEYSASY